MPTRSAPRRWRACARTSGRTSCWSAPGSAPAMAAVPRCASTCACSAPATARRSRRCRSAAARPGPRRVEYRLLIEARSHRVNKEYAQVVEAYQALLAERPDDIDYGLELALAEDVAGDQAGALATLSSLRRLPEPCRDDPRID